MTMKSKVRSPMEGAVGGAGGEEGDGLGGGKVGAAGDVGGEERGGVEGGETPSTSVILGVTLTVPNMLAKPAQTWTSPPAPLMLNSLLSIVKPFVGLQLSPFPKVALPACTP